MDLDPIVFVSNHPLAAARILFAVGCLFAWSFLWGAIKVAYQQATGHAMPRNAFTLTLDVVAILGNNLWGGAQTIARANGGAIFKKPVERLNPPGGPKLPPLPALFFGLTLAMMVACSGARSRLVDVTPTTPPRVTCVDETQRCNGLVPEVCMSDEEGSTVMRWWPMHPLSEQGTAAECATSCVVENGVAGCAR